MFHHFRLPISRKSSKGTRLLFTKWGKLGTGLIVIIVLCPIISTEKWKETVISVGYSKLRDIDTKENVSSLLYNWIEYLTFSYQKVNRCLLLLIDNCLSNQH